MTTSSSNFTGLYGASGTPIVPSTPYGNANVVGLLSAGTDGANTVANIDASGNVTASFFIGDGSQLTNLPPGDYSNANVAAFLPTYSGALAANTISATGNVVTDGYFVGNFAGNITGNLTVPGLNTQVLFNNNGNAGASSDFTFNDATNVMSVNGNVAALNYSGSGAALSNITGANVTGTVANATAAVTAGTATTAGTANIALVANSVAGANVSGAVALATQADTANVANSVAGANVSGVVAQATQAATANVANSVAGANVSGTVASATVAATVSGAAQANITSVGTLTALSVTGNVTSGNVNTAGNVSANYFLGNGSLLTGIAASYGNAEVAAFLPTYTGAMTAMTGNITTTGNITGAYIFGNGSQLTGLPATYGNANVAAYLPTYTGAMAAMTGNVTTTANVQAAFFIGDGSQLTNLPAGTYGNANVTSLLASFGSNTISTTGNISGGNMSVTGVVRTGAVLSNPGSLTLLAGKNTSDVSTSYFLADGPSGNATIQSYSGSGPAVQNWVFDTAGNVTLPSDTAAINYANGVNILSGVTSTYGNANVAAYLPTYTGNLGTVGGGLVAANITSIVAGELDVGTWAISSSTNDIVGTGIISTTGNVVANNVSGTLRTGNQPFITNVGTLGSLNVTTDIGALGNITSSGNLTTSGVLSAAGNVNASQNIVATGNVTGGNITTGGQVTATGNVRGGNITTGGQVSATGNIATSGFFIGDGSLLTNIPGSSYGNANVAAYLPTYTGNLGAGNVNLVGTENSVFGEGAGLNGATGISTSDRLVAIGYQAGNIGNASQSSTLVGWRAGYANGGTNTVAIGRNAGNNAQSTYAVAVGSLAGANAQGLEAVAVGYNAGANGQGIAAIAIGSNAGLNQGVNSIAIGSNTGNAAVANSIVISTQGGTATNAGLYIDPVRADSGNAVNAVFYNTTTKEVTYANAAAGANTQIQFNSNGALSGNSNLTFNSATGNIGLSNLIVNGAQIQTSPVWAPDGGNAVTGANGRVVIGTGWNGNIAYNPVPSRLAPTDTIARTNTGTAVRQFNAESIVSINANVTSGTFRQQAVGTQLRVGGGAAANTIALSNTVGAIFAVAGGQFNVEIGNSSPYGLGNTTVSHAVIHGGALGTSAGSTLTNAFGFNALINAPVGTSAGNITNYTGYSTSINSTVSGNVFMFYNGSNATASSRSISVSNGTRAATNYYFLMNEDDVAQNQLGSLRRYHKYQFNTATSGTVNIDKNNAQVQYLTPTANVTIGDYQNFVTNANDGTNNDPQSDTVTLIIEQGATPYTVTLPTGNASIKYANAVSTVGTTANAVTVVTIAAIRGAANAAVYLTTVSSEFV